MRSSTLSRGRDLQGEILARPLSSYKVAKLLLAVPLLLLVISSVVFPNSLQLVTAGSLVLSFAIFFSVLKEKPITASFIVCFGLGAIVTVTYLLVGVLHEAPLAAVQQVFIIYIFSPFLWFYVLSSVLYLYGPEFAARSLSVLAFCCCISVALYFYIYFIYGPEYVEFFKKNPNINISDGRSAAIMHVYGSLIFLSGGFFSSPKLIRSVSFRYVLLISLFLAAITSGRAALILTIPLGMFLGAFFSHRPGGSFSKNAFLGLSMVVVMLSAASYFLLDYWGIDSAAIADGLADKIASGGGSARTEQMGALLEGAGSDYFLGAGHGVGVDYIRSQQYPWRYETVWFATLYRVGVLGSIVYFLPFAVYTYYVIRRHFKQGLSSFETFLFGGFLCAFVASNTNPYIEAVPLQWMYILPLSFFALRKKHFMPFK